MDKGIEYSIVIPVYNEEQSISKTIHTVKKVMSPYNRLYEIIIINDGSKDNTSKILSSINFISVINHEFNMGYGASILDGVKAAKSNTIITTDADGTYPFEEIPNLLSKIHECVLVSGSRTGKKVKIPFIRKFGKIFHTLAISLAAGKYIPDMNSGLRVFRRDIFLKFKSFYPTGFSISTTFLLASVINGYNIEFVPIDYHQREGKSKIKIFKDGFNFIILILRVLSYFNPLRIFLPLSLTFLLIGIGDSAIMFIINNRLGISDSALLFIVSSIIILLFGLIADMISKVLLQLNER